MRRPSVAVRTGLVGCDQRSVRNIPPCLLLNPSRQLAALCDLDEAILTRLNHLLKVQGAEVAPTRRSDGRRET